jgi:hypothetical protein
MIEEFVPYELALELKELGFDEEGFGMYGKNGSVLPLVPYTSEDKAILFQQAFRWFREKFNLESHIKKDWENGICLGYESIIECEDGIIDCGTHNIYEEAELACLDKLIAILETKQQEQ